MIRIIVFSLLTAILISSCMVGPKPKKQNIDIPPKYSQSTDTTARLDTLSNLKWWELYQDTVLVNLIKIALENNKDYQIMISRIEEARANLGFVRADLYPELNYGGRAGYYSPSKNNPDETGGASERGSLSLYGQLSWELDIWGKLRHAKRAAEALMNMTIYEKRALKVLLISDVASTYFLLRDLDNRLQISKKTLKTRQTGLKIIQEKFKAGEIPQLDLNQAEIQVYIADAAVPFYERQVKYVEHILNILLGQVPTPIPRGEELTQQEIIPEIPTGVPSELLYQRPDVVQAYYYYLAQNEEIGEAVAMRFPSINVGAFAGLAAQQATGFFSADALYGNAAAGLVGPIFNWGKNIDRVTIQSEQAKQALLTYENKILNALVEVDNALIAIKTFKKEYEARRKQAIAAANYLRLSMARYDKGYSSYLEVLDAQRSLFNAELQASKTLQQSLNAVVELYRALGGGWYKQ